MRISHLYGACNRAAISLFLFFWFEIWLGFFVCMKNCTIVLWIGEEALH
jgi:hypothetical protein